MTATQGMSGADGSGGPTTHTRHDVAMDTVVTLRVDTAAAREAVTAAMERALGWFAAVEACCSRFDERSELVELALRYGVAVPVSPLLLEAVAFALDVAQLTDGIFDPVVGALQQRRGFDRLYTSGQRTAVAALPVTEAGSYRDVDVDRGAGTVTLRRPLLLDLGAVAKGFAIDLAARELAVFERYAVEAGGDIFAGGADASAEPWRVGVRHPREADTMLAVLGVMNAAACTSGDYERPGRSPGEHHIVDPRTGRSPRGVASATVLAPTAMVADALATAAFLLGPARGLRLLTRQGVEGLIATSNGAVRTTPRFSEHCL